MAPAGSCTNAGINLCNFLDCNPRQQPQGGIHRDHVGSRTSLRVGNSWDMIKMLSGVSFEHDGPNAKVLISVPKDGSAQEGVIWQMPWSEVTFLSLSTYKPKCLS